MCTSPLRDGYVDTSRSVHDHECPDSKSASSQVSQSTFTQLLHHLNVAKSFLLPQFPGRYSECALNTTSETSSVQNINVKVSFLNPPKRSGTIQTESLIFFSFEHFLRFD